MRKNRGFGVNRDCSLKYGILPPYLPTKKKNPRETRESRNVGSVYTATFPFINAPVPQVMKHLFFHKATNFGSFTS